MEAVRPQIAATDAAKFIQSRTMITEPGKYNLQVVGNPQHYEGKVIINLKAMTPTGLEKAKQLLREGKANEAANTNLTASVFPDRFVPAKGEYVSVMVDFVTARDGSSVLGVTSIAEIKARAAAKVSLGEEFANLLDSVKSASAEPSLD